MVAARQRRIRHARLRCALPEQAAHARVLLEDALRTASLPDQGRLIVYRRVDLGRLSPRGSAIAWSRRLERRLQGLAADAVYFAEPAAATAAAVWFPDAWQPALELAVRVRRGPAPAAWFWPIAVPGWTPGLPPRDTARLILRRLAECGGAPATLALARRLWREGRLLEFAEELSPVELAAWAPLPDDRTETDDADRAECSRPPLRWALPVSAQLALRDWMQSRRPAPAVLGWVLAGVLAEHRGAPAEPEVLRRAAARLLARLEPTPAPAPTPPMPAESAAAARIVREPHVPPLLPAGQPAAPAQPKPALYAPATVATRPTVAGGLLFALNLLRRLGWPQWLPAESRPQAAELTANWLRGLAGRLALPAEDAVIAWLEKWGELPTFPELATPPDLLRENLSPTQAVRVLQWPLRLSLTLAMQRLCWRRARLGWRPLVRRPARLSWTATHVDVFFTHRQADVRVRRAGLDLDPGWVPWLGRVVSFHYVEELPA